MSRSKRVPSERPPPSGAIPGASGPTSDRGDFPIVGIGASAGGLEAFTHLLKELPSDTGMGFVFVQHLAPKHGSALAEILARATRMSVTEVQDNPAVEPDHVYVIPPGKDLDIAQGRLHLRQRPAGGAHHPIDQFFRGLAEERRHRAIGVVLSGTATDGTIGLQAIKAEGGITFAQDGTAQHDGMPHSAIASGCVDFVLPPAAIAQEIVRIGQHAYAAPAVEPRPPMDLGGLSEILRVLRQATGVDFTHYKLNTLMRRVSRRMVLAKIDEVRDYLRLIRQEPAEVEALYHDILINVTSFFRNPDAFEALKVKVFPQLVARRSRHDPVRIWSLGCSTGQEAYSLAMAFTEFADSAGSAVPLQVFATDLEDKGLSTARAGVYPKDIAQDVSPERLRRFFVETDAGYQMGKSIRAACVFSRHNVLADPPFSRIDLISCRNLLIYLESVLQQQVLPILHYALKPTGFLWLGSSETIGGFRSLFETEDAKFKIYARKAAPHAPRFPLLHPSERRAPPTRTRPPGTGTDLSREAERLLLSKFAPPGVVVSADLDIVHYRGDAAPYLAPAPGAASLNLLKMLREGLLVGVRNAIARADKERGPVRAEGLRVASAGGQREIAVEVVPLKGGGNQADPDAARGYLILFQDASAPSGSTGASLASPPPPSDEPASDQELERLRQELSATREYLQSVIEQQDAANEELQSANEEVQSANEELQSVNEELETSKEEIQSSNEELVTVNEELSNRNLEANRINDDLVNLIGSAQIPFVIVGRDLRVRRFSQAAEKLLALGPADIGRPLADLRLDLEDLPDLAPLLTEVIDTVTGTERDVRDRRGRWYSLRLRPYKTLDNTIDGAVVMLLDVDAMKRAREYTEAIVNTVREPLVVLDTALRVRTANASFYRIFQAKPEETEGRTLDALGRGSWNIPRLRQGLEQVVRNATVLNDFEVEAEFETLGTRTMLLNARKIVQPGEDDPLILLAIEDITERKAANEALLRHTTDLTDADRRKDEFLAMLAHELRNPLAPIHTAVQLLRTEGAPAAASERARDIIERQVKNMTRLIDDLVDVARITRGKIGMKMLDRDLVPILKHAVEMVRPQVAERGQTLSLDLPQEPLHVSCDATRLEQVFGNILNNASKYTPRDGHIWITAEAKRADGRDTEALVRIRDDGIGIAAGMQSGVFDLFTQVGRSPHQAAGLGIGLSLVQRIVALHGGRVDVHSTGKDRGSEFVVALPLRAGPLPAAARVKRPEAQPGGALSRRVLVVDDNVDAAESLADLLRVCAHEVRVAHDGDAALDTAAAFLPEIVFLDIRMDGLDGYEVARRLRQLTGLDDVQIVAVTGFGKDEDRRLAKDAGFDRYVTKPLDPKALPALLALPPPDASV